MRRHTARLLVFPPTLALALMLVVWHGWFVGLSGQAGHVQFVFTSDAHYGISRAAFRGGANVPARIVNRALVAAINTLPAARFPDDGGVDAGRLVGPVTFLVEGGDIANRQEQAAGGFIQQASVSWTQFAADYFNGLTVTDAAGRRSPLFVVAGNHESTDAVGFYKPMRPAIDKTALVEIYNRMLAPALPRTARTFDYARDRVLYSRDIGGIHFMFLAVWPDSASRQWMERDLAPVSPSRPAIVFVHDQPQVEAKHFRNPNGRHDVNAADRFENLLSDTLKDGATVDSVTTAEQRELEAFLRRHRNITAYFHGNANWNEFYTWTGPDHTVSLRTFRVDSPMKGAVSSKDETKLSFHVATIDPTTHTMTVRECLWNSAARHPPSPLAWGGSVTVPLLAHRPARSLRGG